MKLIEAFKLSKENINSNIYYIREIGENRFVAYSLWFDQVIKYFIVAISDSELELLSKQEESN